MSTTTPVRPTTASVCPGAPVARRQESKRSRATRPRKFQLPDEPASARVEHELATLQRRIARLERRLAERDETISALEADNCEYELLLGKAMRQHEIAAAAADAEDGVLYAKLERIAAHAAQAAVRKAVREDAF